MVFNLTFLFLNITSDLHFVINLLYLQSWCKCLVLIVDSDDDDGVPTSSRVFLTWIDFMKGFFLAKQTLLQLLNFALKELVSLLVLQSCSVRSFFSKTSEPDLGIPEVFAVSLIGYTHIYWNLFGVHMKSSSEQLNSTLGINSGSFISFLGHEITKEQASTDHETSNQADVRLCWSLWNMLSINILLFLHMHVCLYFSGSISFALPGPVVTVDAPVQAWRLLNSRMSGRCWRVNSRRRRRAGLIIDTAALYWVVAYCTSCLNIEHAAVSGHL